MRPLTPKFPKLLHGGDYNPEQWLRYPEILKQDVELMKKADINCVSVGIFSWAHLEPNEGEYDFDWLEKIIDNLYKNGIYTVLATPSGAKPLWMSEKYEEIRRVQNNGVRDLSGARHNHCYTSPVYREKTREMDKRLAKRFANHPGVILWHLSNEYGGECYCPLCQQAFRDWLKKKYKTLDDLNHAWWTDFWSHTYTSWDQIHAPQPNGEMNVHGLTLDWKRFVTYQTVDFMKMERDAVKEVNPDIPVTANLMGFYDGLDYFKFGPELDVVSWDNYPQWHTTDNVEIAVSSAMTHDVMRSIKHENFLLMESTPSMTNWTPISMLKRPGMHLLSSMQAVAHGSNSVQYFQFRKSRGSCEKFHGAVVDHDGRGDTRVFRDVTQVGQALETLQPLYSKPNAPAKACILFDWSNWWAIDYAQTGQKGNMRYFDSVNMHYRALWEQGIAVDFRDMRPCTDLSQYRLVVAPMLFLMKEGFSQKLRAFVENGGTLLMTYFSGVVDDSGLAYLGGAPHDLTDVLGVRATELDALYPQDVQHMVFPDGRRYAVHELCELPEKHDAQVLAEYGEDFYAGLPCLTKHAFGAGQAYYLAAKPEQDGLDAIYTAIAAELSLPKAMQEKLPTGVIATERGGAAFVQNYSGKTQQVTLDGSYEEMMTGEVLSGTQEMPVNGVWVLKKQA